MEDMCGALVVSRLSQDILWYIFSLNTFDDGDLLDSSHSIDTENYFLTARHTSQVCAKWRSIIVSSSYIWANIINLDHLNQKSHYWRNEILRRTGNCSLSIIATLRKGDLSSDFFISLIDLHWDRIRRLLLSVDSEYRNARDPTWNILQRPAPNMQLFSAHFPGNPVLLDTLFSNDAPSMDTLYTAYLGYKLSPPHFHSLRSLDISANPVGKGILHALSTMSLLEDLTLCKIADDDSYGREYPKVNLPHLKYLHLSACLSNIAVLLDHITPTPGCLFTCWVLRESTLLSDSVISSFMCGFSAHFKNHLDTFICRVIALVHDTDTFSLLTYHDQFPLLVNEESSDFDFQMDFKCTQITEPIMEYMSSLGAVTSLRRLDLQLTMPNDLSNVALSKLLYSLANIEKLQMTCCTINSLMEIERRNYGKLLFPLLKRIRLLPNDENELCSASISCFLYQREKRGNPIKSIDLSQCDLAKDILALHFHPELEVVWSTKMINFMDSL